MNVKPKREERLATTQIKSKALVNKINTGDCMIYYNTGNIFINDGRETVLVNFNQPMAYGSYSINELFDKEKKITKFHIQSSGIFYMNGNFYSWENYPVIVELEGDEVQDMPPPDHVFTYMTGIGFVDKSNW